jgi:mono/diheme cytochrome c family protein
MKYLIGALSAIVLIIILFVVFLYSGVYNISATDHHQGVTMWIINTLKDNSVKSYADDVKDMPDLSDTSLINSGFNHYKNMCAGCHGAPGIDKLAKGFYPDPPLLTEEAEEWNSKELFWIIKNGIKMTAMPAFGITHPDEDIWAIVAFTQKVPQMTNEEYQNLLNQSAKEQTQ